MPARSLNGRIAVDMQFHLTAIHSATMVEVKRRTAGALLAAACLCIFQSAAGSTNLTCTADVRAAIDAGIPGQDFDVCAKVIVSTKTPHPFVAIDKSGGVRFNCHSNIVGTALRSGDMIRARGKTIRTFENRARAICTAVDVLSHGQPPAVVDVSAKDLWQDDLLYHPVRISGSVMHAFSDEIDLDCAYLILDCNGETAYVALDVRDPESFNPSSLIGAQVRVQGTCETLRHSNRRQVVRLVCGVGKDAVEILSPKPDDPFQAPHLSIIYNLRPEEIQKLGRLVCSGRVLAVWDRSDMLIKALDGEIIRVDTIQDSFPKPGDAIDVVGIPSVISMRVSLSKSFWRPSTESMPEVKPPSDVLLHKLLMDSKGRRRIDVNYYGEPITVKGRILSLTAGEGENCLLLESDGLTIEVYAGRGTSFPENLCCGCRVSVSGTFIVETDAWKSTYLLPEIKRAKVITKDDSGIEILSFPPWWTTQRLIAAIAILGVSILTILAWNILLRRLSERRGQELARENLARAETDMKVFERTRLAVELHDSVAQSISAITMELETAGRYRTGASDDLLHHLGTAQTILNSCREELRNCLWDLRNQALEEPTMEQAIRKTLLPHAKDIRLSIRFAYPRAKLTDNTAHIILRIIRELVINAVRHGHADDIRIAGAPEADMLMFSVTDNGSGFDPSGSPGVTQGHFGLQGVRERIRPFSGTLRITSSKGAGTKATVSLHLPHANLS